MTEAEIMKALEYCRSENSCEGCPYEFEGEFCEDNLKQDCIDLINRKNAENERWKTECGNQSVLWQKHFESIFESAKETVKEEAIKEFAERLKEKYKRHFSSEWSAVYNTIDQIAKEMGVE